MPVITIEFDKSIVSETDMQKLVKASHEIVSGVTAIEDVPVYAHSAEYTAEIAPIEIFIRLSAHKVEDAGELTARLKEAYADWKKAQDFPHSINMTFIPMQWNIEIGI